MAVVFLEGRMSPIPMQTANTTPLWTPVVQCVNSRIVESKDAQIPNANCCRISNF
jgi:hypothetical protein